ncbi:TetR/AcrR family transcriptional regulator C-terminal domain-containing protein [Actinomadura citrea]|uniref:TetR/AcrR family transcriptional regulator n=1 Tax=Actinomadura citrea TaxID=46158 RepID=UPI002E2BD431|nr:TetR family transcriptional regulator [Actinomadura citrea]
MAPEKLTRAAVLDRALKLADADGLDTVTIRRLAQELGVTPMALYWHFKNKEQLLVGMLDAVFGQVTADIDPAEPWQRRLRIMVEALTAEFRRHPWISEISQTTDKNASENFLRATDVALELLGEAGFPVDRGFQIATHLLGGVVNLIATQPSGTGSGCGDTAGLRRDKRLALETAAAGRYPRLEEYARTLEHEPDVEAYFSFGLDLLLSGVERMAESAGDS